MRSVFIGAVDFSRHALLEVLENGGLVVGIFTLAPEHAGFHADYADLSAVAGNIPVFKIKNIGDAGTIEKIRTLKPDVIFVFGWSQLLPKALLESAPLGCIGTHPALLPKNRGRHPLVWTLVEGLQESGLTFLHLDEGADTGDILWQKSFPIILEDDAASLYEKIKALASKAIREILPQLASGRAPRIPQDHTQATTWRKRGEKDGEIRWEAPSLEIYNLIRALARPYVGAHTELDGARARIWKARLPDRPLPGNAARSEPGTVLDVHGGKVHVKTGDGYLTLLEYEMTGNKKLKAGVRLGARS